ncbi:MAG: hypothetical protein ACRCR4_00910 [Thiotrichaceae bacterium]
MEQASGNPQAAREARQQALAAYRREGRENLTEWLSNFVPLYVRR